MTAATIATAAPRHLPQRGLFKLPDAAGLQIECRSGSLWITLDEDPRDFVIEAGERFVTDEHKPVIVYALRAAELQVRARDEGLPRARWTPLPAPARTATA